MDQNDLGQGSGGQESLKERKVKDFTVAKDPDTTSWQTASGISRKDCAFVARLKPSHKVAIQTHCDRDRFLSGDGSPSGLRARFKKVLELSTILCLQSVAE